MTDSGSPSSVTVYPAATGSDEDAMSVLAITGLTERPGMTARALRALSMAALTADRPEEAFSWLRRLAADDGQARHNRKSLFGLNDLAEAARRTGQEAEVGRFVRQALDVPAGDHVPFERARVQPRA